MKHVSSSHDIIEYYEIYRRDELNGYCVKCFSPSPVKVGIRKRGSRYIDGFHRYCVMCSDYQKCLECDLEFIDNTSLMVHVNKLHDILEYHNKYLRTKENGYCCECGKPTPVQINNHGNKIAFEGFKKYCSDICHTKGRQEWTRKSVIKLWEDKDYRLKMSNLAVNRILDPNNDFGYGDWGDSMPKRKRRGKFNNIPVRDKELGIKFRSKFEWRAARRFEKAGIKWKFEPKVTLMNGSYCLPDFFLPDYDLFIELRPRKMIDEKLLSKIRAIKHMYKKEVVLCTNIQGVATFISRLNEDRPKLNESTVWIFEDKRGEEKHLREIRG